MMLKEGVNGEVLVKGGRRIYWVKAEELRAVLKEEPFFFKLLFMTSKHYKIIHFLWWNGGTAPKFPSRSILC